MLGTECGACFNAVPSNSFLNGPIEKEIVQKVRQRRAPRPKMDPNEKEENPDDLRKMEKTGNELSATEEHLQVIARTLKRRCTAPGEGDDRRKKKVKKVCAVKFLVNPQSFTQTVENIFHYSYLVRSGKAAIAVDKKTGLPTVKPKDLQAGTPTPRQAILAFNMSDWRKLTREFGVDKGDIPHRKTPAT
mmetsp:Transcript_25213/g.58247  ORF Transcript_25213/g.58247 Transcript_25213/m.58247 type:complete len:189 (-) Transcript_25213:223-789(-)|eukprot:CAMPEP_0113300572 /NCGR_PEP_ID=MMETSP0010_2-20120614/2145_1 /TAXON_ID=216773 ORGANISM="Corethron hystrix, Strain 308" /NCGR_SAMPLE_ID=MMETSP0010_2 /ASSEMBLY_ACC=CAM_ASM_000155 /LENGTH=188 /DNA_ID=CAMNT_0000154017 /DNA_START=278 /DNA_END=844 /DNA_ORIENTATION=- /assembly_acc=CAM_ASM_000155